MSLQPLVSVIILTRNKVDYLRNCVNSLLHNNDYENLEIIIVNNNSDEKETFQYFEELKDYKHIKVYNNDMPFNYSALNNFGASFAIGEYLLFLNNDIEFITSNTIYELVETAREENVGVVGAVLLYPDNTIQHAGVNVHKNGAWQPYRNAELEELPFINNKRRCSAVIGACLLVSSDNFRLVDGFEENLKVVLNDIDFCLKLDQKGLYTICSPIRLYHYEGISRGKKSPKDDVDNFIKKWSAVINYGDPYDESFEISKEHLNQYFSRYRNSNKRPVYIFGTGAKGERAIDILKQLNIPITNFLDNDSNKWGTRFGQYDVCSPLEILATEQKFPFIVIASMYYAEIKEQLNDFGLELYKDFYRVY
ncbi:glycosyltransferase [Psychrobacillus sp. NPDC096623]|uniref:glycosyltransferase n=1 Tax=Psychrobacillus sp. NPDC096623 TaxID=3364492 RepID=UPI0037FAB53C